MNPGMLVASCEPRILQVNLFKKICAYRWLLPRHFNMDCCAFANCTVSKAHQQIPWLNWLNQIFNPYSEPTFPTTQLKLATLFQKKQTSKLLFDFPVPPISMRCSSFAICFIMRIDSSSSTISFTSGITRIT